MTYYTTVATRFFDGDLTDIYAYVGFGPSSQDATLNAIRSALHQLIEDDEGNPADLSSCTYSELNDHAESIGLHMSVQCMGEVPS